MSDWLDALIDDEQAHVDATTSLDEALFGDREDYTAVPWLDSLLACRACPARDEARRVVPGYGPLTAEIAIVGQNPGEEEDAMGVAFVGRSGAELDVWLEKLGLAREKVLVTNAVKCFPGTVHVDASDVQRGYRRWYDGELVVVRTRDGELPGTPNHPVLTQRGWVLMGRLQQGDYLVRGGLGEGVPLRNPHVQGQPRQFTQVFDTLSNLGVRQGVIGRDVDFHGDGRQTEVEVVTTDGLLRNRRESTCFQHGLQHVLEPADHTPRRLHPTRPTVADALAMQGALLAAFGGLVRFHHEVRARVGRSTPPTQTQGVRQAARRLSEGLQPFSDGFWRDAEGAAEGDRTLPVAVAFDQIIEIVRRPYAGHVYNLQTASGEYIANGFIVHNCHTNRNRPPKPKELAICRDLWMRKEIETFTALKVLIPLGKPALLSLLGEQKHLPPAMQPWWADVAVDTDATRTLFVMPLPHPAYLLRSPNLREQMYGEVLPVVRSYLETQTPEVYARARS